MGFLLRVPDIKHAIVLKRKNKKKKIKKKDINGKNVLSCPQAKQAWVPFPFAIYHIGT